MGTQYTFPLPSIIPYSGSAIASATMTEGKETTEDDQLQWFLTEELAKFADVKGSTDRISHVICVDPDQATLPSENPPPPPAMQQIIDEEVAKIEKVGIIEPSNSGARPLVIVRKKDGRSRFCIDFRKVNEATERDAYPLPQITVTLDKLRGAKYLFSLDLKDRYWQVPLAPQSRPRSQSPPPQVRDLCNSASSQM